MSIDTPFKETFKETREPLICGGSPLIFELGDGIVGIVQEMYVVDTDEDFCIEFEADLATSSEVEMPKTVREKYLDILKEKVENWFSEAIYAQIATLEEANGGEPNQD